MALPFDTLAPNRVQLASAFGEIFMDLKKILYPPYVVYVKAKPLALDPENGLNKP